MTLSQPEHQRSRRVQRNLQFLIVLKDVQERQVTVLVGLLEDAVEIPNRLVIVQDEAKMNVVRHVSRITNR